MARRVIALFAAVLVAIVGMVAVLIYVRGADARAIQGAEPRTVFVTVQPVAAGTPLVDAVRGGMLVRTSVAAKAFPLGGLSEVTEANQQLVAITDIGVGEYVLAARFGTTPSGRKAISIPAGQVGISIKLEDPARVGSFVTPGSRIVIFDTFLDTANPPAASPTAGSPQDPRSTRVLFDDVFVIGMGESSLTPATTGTNQAAGGFLVTVALSPTDAARLVHAVRTGALYAGLRGADASMDLGYVVTDANLFEKR